MDELLKSPLNDRHVAAGAKFSEFAGWSMPLEYAGTLAEHATVREHVGLFDVSHLGNARVSGPGALEFLNAVLANDFAKAGPGKALYQLLCNEQGGIIDDLIAYVISGEDILLIPNAANTTTVVDVLTGLAPEGIQITNEHRDHAIIAVQGPDSERLLDKLGFPTDLEYMAFEEYERDGQPMTLCRTGYTGEKGFEIVCSNELAPKLWDELMAAGEEFQVAPCGLGARDTLRTEMGYSLHGNDISPYINPVEAGLSWAVGWKKPEFQGRDALLAIKEAGPARRMRGLKPVGRGIPRHGMTVVAVDASADDADPIGIVTSGTFSPTLKHGIGLALVESSLTFGDQVGVIVRNRVELFELVKPPFVQTDVRS